MSGRPSEIQAGGPGEPVSQLRLGNLPGFKAAELVPLPVADAPVPAPRASVPGVAATEPSGDVPTAGSTRTERPLVIGVGSSTMTGPNVNAHYNLTDDLAIGGSVGSNARGKVVSADLRKYVASERNWAFYLQPSVHVGVKDSSVHLEGIGTQLGLEYRMNGGLTFNAGVGAGYSFPDRKFGPAVSVGLSLAF